MSSSDKETALEEAPGGSAAAAELVRLAKRRIAAQAGDVAAEEDDLGLDAGERLLTTLKVHVRSMGTITDGQGSGLQLGSGSRSGLGSHIGFR